MKENEYVNALNELKISSDMKERIINNTMKKKTKQTTRKWKYGLITAASVLLVGGAFLTKHPITQLSDTNLQNLSLTVYAAKEEGSYLSANFSSDSVATVLKPYSEVPLSNYNPFMSSVPGLPITLSIEKNEKTTSTATLSISCTTGTFCEWDQKTGKILEKGNNSTCIPGATIYWKPDVNENSANEDNKDSYAWKAKNDIKNVSRITITAVDKNNKNSGQQALIIGKNDINYFAVLEDK